MALNARYAVLPLALILAGHAVAETNSRLPIVAAMQAASGAAWSGVRMLHLTMALHSGGETARAERLEDITTGRYLFRTEWPDRIELDGFDGITPWHQGRSGIAYTLGDIDGRLVAADESFRVARAWWFPERHAATIAFRGTGTEAGHEYDVLDITPEAGRPFQAWIDHTTHLLARTDEQQAEDRVVTTYADYRPVHGLMLPFTIRTGDGTDPAADEVATVQSVQINAAFPDTAFGIPAQPPADIESPPHTNAVEVPFHLTADNRILVPLTIGGHTLQAEFDSGGSLLLQPATVALIGATATGQIAQGGGGEGITTASIGRLEEIALGGAKLHNLAFHSFAFDPEDPQRALVGLEILQRFVVRFDFDRQVMTLTRPGAFRYTGTGIVVPFQFQDNQPEVVGSIDGIAGLFTIDTGDSGSLLLLAPFARRYDLVERYHADLPYAGTAVTATHGVWARKRPATVAFNGPDGRAAAEVHEPVTRISLQHFGFDADRDVSANIGLGILRQFNVTFDYGRRRIILEPNHLNGVRDVFNRAGLRLKRDAATWSITTIYPGSPAASSGLKPGDIVSRINGQPPAALEPDEVWNKLKGPVGATLRLHILSPGAPRDVTLVLRDFL